MLTIFFLGINSFKITFPFICLFGSAPTYFICWSFIKMITTIFFSKKSYRKYDDYLYSIYQRFILFFFQNSLHVKIYLHGDYEEIFKKKENVLYMSNHQSSVDWIIANILAIHQGSLGHIRYIVKNDLKWIPFYGFYFQQHGFIFVRRNDKEDILRVEKGIKQIQYNGLPIWLVIFPEGTRFNSITNQINIQKSKDFAKKKDLIQFDYVLYPRTGAIINTIKNLHENLNAIYDITIMYNQTYDQQKQIRLPAPSMFEYLQNKINELHIDIRRIDINNIQNEQISHWIYQRFALKDKLLKKFYECQSNKSEFRSDINDKPIELELPLKETLPSFLFFTLTTMSFLITKKGRSIYSKVCLFGIPITILWMHLFPPSKID